MQVPEIFIQPRQIQSTQSVQNIFFLINHYFNSFVYIAQQAGQAVMLGHLSLTVCLWRQTLTAGGRRRIRLTGNFKDDRNIYLGYFCNKSFQCKNIHLLVALQYFPGSFVPTLQYSTVVKSRSILHHRQICCFSLIILLRYIGQVDSFTICIDFQELFDLRSRKKSSTDQKKVWLYSLYSGYLPTTSCIHWKCCAGEN